MPTAPLARANRSSATKLPSVRTAARQALFYATLPLLAYLAYNHADTPQWYRERTMHASIRHIDATDTAALKAALFHGEPHLIQCYSSLPHPHQHLPPPYKIHPHVSAAADALAAAQLSLATVDCERRLPSNRSLVDKLGLVRRTQPLLILALNGEKPKQLPAAAVASADAIAQYAVPRARPVVHRVSSQKALLSACGTWRPCLLTRLPHDSRTLEALAHRFRGVVFASVGEDAARVQLKWGRGAEVGETLDDDEAAQFGQRTSVLLPDPEAPRPAKKAKKRDANPPRLLRGFGGSEDEPSLAAFLEQWTRDNMGAPREASDGLYRTALPTVVAAQPPPQKARRGGGGGGAPTRNDNAEVQARRAKARREAAQAAAREEVALKAKMTDEQRKAREAQRRAQMAREEEQAGNIVEEVDDDFDDEVDGGDDGGGDDNDDSATRDVVDDDDDDVEELDLDM